MSIRVIINLLILILIVMLPGVVQAESLIGNWCENGGPYICYPPIENTTDTYACTDSTTIVKADDNTIDWVVNQTIHYYSDGFRNGKTKSLQIKRTFTRNSHYPGVMFEQTELLKDVQEQRQLKVDGQSLIMDYKQISETSDSPLVNTRASYQRCGTETARKQFYTALIDCGGSGDYIAGVPAVVNNPLLWDLGDSKANNRSCQVAAKCWGGGWVAFAYSKDQETSKSAFGAACGGTSRFDAKQQAINSCRQSGGTNCFYQVVSGYDNGNNSLADNIHKGEKVEFCRSGNCEAASR